MFRNYHHHWYYALRQDFFTSHSMLKRSLARLFSSTLLPQFFRPPNSSLLLRSLTLLPANLPSKPSLNKPSPLNICTIHFFFLHSIHRIRLLSSFNLCNTSTIVTLFFQLIFCIRAQAGLTFQMHSAYPYPLYVMSTLIVRIMTVLHISLFAVLFFK